MVIMCHLRRVVGIVGFRPFGLRLGRKSKIGSFIILSYINAFIVNTYKSVYKYTAYIDTYLLTLYICTCIKTYVLRYFYIPTLYIH